MEPSLNTRLPPPPPFFAVFLYPPDVHTVFMLPNNQSLTACDFSNSTNLSQPNNPNVPPGLVGVNVPATAPGPQYFACQ